MQNRTQYVWGPPVLTFTCPGQPIGQGQIRHLGKGRPAVHANGKRLKPWRQAIAQAATQAIAQHPTPGMFPLDLALATLLVFTMPWSRAAAKEGRLYPTVNSILNSDLDHLERAVYDAMKGVAIVDDSLVVDSRHPKTYPRGTSPQAHPLALPEPGVTIRLYLLPIGETPCPA